MTPGRSPGGRQIRGLAIGLDLLESDPTHELPQNPTQLPQADSKGGNREAPRWSKGRGRGAGTGLAVGFLEERPSPLKLLGKAHFSLEAAGVAGTREDLKPTSCPRRPPLCSGTQLWIHTLDPCPAPRRTRMGAQGKWLHSPAPASWPCRHQAPGPQEGRCPAEPGGASRDFYRFSRYREAGKTQREFPRGREKSSEARWLRGALGKV